MRFLKVMFKLILVIALISIVAAGYARYVEPRLLVSNTISIQSPKITRDTTVTIFSDTHIKKEFSGAELQRIVKKINETSPDVVIFLGDLYDNYGRYKADEELITKHLSDIIAPVKMAVYGNHDYGGSAKNIYKEIMTAAGFKIFKNTNLPTEYGINFMGFDDFTFGTADGPAVYMKDLYNVGFSHAPDTALEYPGYDIFFGAHSHGGQVNLPFVTQKILPGGARTYWRGMAENPDGSSVYVTRGIGTSIINARFNSVPEITICKFSKKTVEN